MLQPHHMTFFTKLIWVLTIMPTVCLLLACADNNDLAMEEPQSKILSAYHGLDALPAGAVETASGEMVTPLCATLAPAIEILEQRTVLLIGSFGTRNAPPLAVEVVGALEDIDGQSLQGERFTNITPLEAGPTLVLAERFEVDAPGLVGECPTATQQVLQLTWEGGVSGPRGSRLGEPQRLGISVRLQDDRTVTPIALADDDPDNHVLVCLDVATQAVSVAAAPGLFHDPGDDANPDTRIDVNTG